MPQMNLTTKSDRTALVTNENTLSQHPWTGLSSHTESGWANPKLYRPKDLLSKTLDKICFADQIFVVSSLLVVVALVCIRQRTQNKLPS
jgi:hypothetical protein